MDGRRFDTTDSFKSLGGGNEIDSSRLALIVTKELTIRLKRAYLRLIIPDCKAQLQAYIKARSGHCVCVCV